MSYFWTELNEQDKICNLFIVFVPDVCLLPAQILVPQAAAVLRHSGPDRQTPQTRHKPKNQLQRRTTISFILEQHVYCGG